DHHDLGVALGDRRRAQGGRGCGGEKVPAGQPNGFRCGFSGDFAGSRPARDRARAHGCCSDHHAAMAAISESEKPLAIRFMTVAGCRSDLKAVIVSTISAALRPLSDLSGVSMPAFTAWQPEQEVA